MALLYYQGSVYFPFSDIGVGNTERSGNCNPASITSGSTWLVLMRLRLLVVLCIPIGGLGQHKLARLDIGKTAGGRAPPVSLVLFAYVQRWVMASNSCRVNSLHKQEQGLRPAIILLGASLLQEATFVIHPRPLLYTHTHMHTRTHTCNHARTL